MIVANCCSELDWNRYKNQRKEKKQNQLVLVAAAAAIATVKSELELMH